MPLKLIVMSATLRVDDFTSNPRLFKIPPPVIKVESRQFTVTNHFSQTTPDDYLKAAFLEVCRIHCNESGGGILVFVTGKQEVNMLVKKLRSAFSSNADHSSGNKKSRVTDSKKPDCKPAVLADILPKINLDE